MILTSLNLENYQNGDAMNDQTRKYRLYDDKSSLRKRNSRYVQGGTTDKLGNRLGWWERRIFTDVDIHEFLFKIDDVYAKRPDLVAEDELGSSELEWIILQYNNIVDINEEFTYGKIIRLPSNSYVRTYIIDRPIGK